MTEFNETSQSFNVAMAVMNLDLIYDREFDAAYVRFSSEKVAESAEVLPGVRIDYDAAGRMVAIEILQARKMLPLETLSTAE
jgi:uncharacterized protein YuzE